MMILLAALNAHAYDFTATCGNTPLHWQTVPVSWWLRTGVVNGQAYSRISDADIVASNTTAWDVWADATTCCSGFQAVYQGTTTSAGAGNNQHVVEFRENSWDPALGSVNSVIAVTRVSYNPQACTFINADQVYNGVGFDFSITTPPGPGFTDLQSIQAHENGHWLGLNHSSVGAATMYYAYSGGTGPRSLHADDDAGVCAIYPGTCGPSESDCDDGVDDDSDGAVDCADSDCALFPVCTCVVDGLVGCDNTITADNFGGSSTVDRFGCANFQTTGPEAVYTFVPNEDGPVTVTLSNLTVDLDLFVTTENAGSCEPNQCVSFAASANSTETLTFEGTAGETYAVVADGFDGAEGTFTLAVDCPDPVGGGTCEAELELPCGTSVSSSNYGAENNVQAFNCVNWTTTGPEQVFTLVPGTTGTVDLSLTGLTADLDLFVTTEAGGQCSEGACVASSGNGADNDEALSFEGVANQTYMVVVDGWDGATSDFTIHAGCVPPEAPPDDTDVPPVDTDVPVDTDAPVDTGLPPLDFEPITCTCSGTGSTGSLAWLGLLGLVALRARKSPSIHRDR